MADPIQTAPTDALIERLRGLLAKAGAGGEMWTYRSVGLSLAIRAPKWGSIAKVFGSNERCEANAALIVEAINALPSLLARIEAAEKVIAPFAEAATHVPRDREDQNIVALVPGGHNASAFQQMRTPLTAGNLRAAAQWQAGQEGEG